MSAAAVAGSAANPSAASIRPKTIVPANTAR